jgi:hypothetical protein
MRTCDPDGELGVLAIVIFLSLLVGGLVGMGLEYKRNSNEAIKAGVGRYNPTNGQFVFISVDKK